MPSKINDTTGSDSIREARSHVILQDKVNQPQIYGLKRLYTGRGRNEISYAGLKLANYDKYTEYLRNNVAI